MKILTLNTHSLLEDRYREKLHWFVDAVVRERPDIIALQEVNQSVSAELMDPAMLEGHHPLPGSIPIRSDNHAAHVARLLQQAGLECYWVWMPIKLGFGKYDEGVAVLSIGRPFRSVDQIPMNRVHDYQDWRSRAALGVKVEGWEDWFYCLHMGWWNDGDHDFLSQWKILNSCIASKWICGPVWLMGDFNAPDIVSGQGYDHVVSCGWIDTHLSARHRDRGFTVAGLPGIPGAEAVGGHVPEGVRLDYIFSSRPREILSSRVMFNGTGEPVISDHYGVLIETAD